MYLRAWRGSKLLQASPPRLHGQRVTAAPAAAAQALRGHHCIWCWGSGTCQWACRPPSLLSSSGAHVRHRRAARLGAVDAAWRRRHAQVLGRASPPEEASTWGGSAGGSGSVAPPPTRSLELTLTAALQLVVASAVVQVLVLERAIRVLTALLLLRPSPSLGLASGCARTAATAPRRSTRLHVLAPLLPQASGATPGASALGCRAPHRCTELRPQRLLPLSPARAGRRPRLQPRRRRLCTLQARRSMTLAAAPALQAPVVPAARQTMPAKTAAAAAAATAAAQVRRMNPFSRAMTVRMTKAAVAAAIAADPVAAAGAAVRRGSGPGR
jgi:hypothetical protein